MMLFLLPHGARGHLRHDGKLPGAEGLSKETLVYYEVLDWAYPRANYLDVRLMGILEPWDFAKVGPFDPAMQEGDFRVVSVDASTKDQVVIDKLALDIAGNDAEAFLGFNKKSIRTWARKARKHKDGLMMVPVYFVDRPATDSRDGEQVRIAINGQTGRAAAVVFSDKRETHVVASLNPSVVLSSESTVHATPIEVKYVKSPFLYQIVRRGGGEQPRQVAAAAEGSYREEKPKRRGLFGALFGK
ncbi:MAG: hypothetical protein ACLU7D_01580 [Collinsella sp.]